jgi:hypothetical protein
MGHHHADPVYTGGNNNGEVAEPPKFTQAASMVMAMEGLDDSFSRQYRLCSRIMGCHHQIRVDLVGLYGVHTVQAGNTWWYEQC